MKNNITELVFILDRSGSMAGLEGDTIGGAVRHIQNIHKYARPEDVPEHTMFVITTDGMENASHRYSSAQVKAMLEQEKFLPKPRIILPSLLTPLNSGFLPSLLL